jgi:hypothetical protein
MLLQQPPLKTGIRTSNTTNVHQTQRNMSTRFKSICYSLVFISPKHLNFTGGERDVGRCKSPVTTFSLLASRFKVLFSCLCSATRRLVVALQVSWYESLRTFKERAKSTRPLISLNANRQCRREVSKGIKVEVTLNFIGVVAFIWQLLGS